MFVGPSSAASLISLKLESKNIVIGSRKSNCAANSYTHVLFIVIINKPLLFFDVQSATPPKTPQETKNDVSISYS